MDEGVAARNILCGALGQNPLGTGGKIDSKTDNVLRKAFFLLDLKIYITFASHTSALILSLFTQPPNTLLNMKVKVIK